MHIIIVAILSWQLFKSQTFPPLKKYFWFGLFSKLLAGVLVGLVYRYYYSGGDTWSFFESARNLALTAPSDPGGYLNAFFTGSVPSQVSESVGYLNQPRALLMVRLLSVPVLLTGGNYWISSIYLSLFSFSGLWKMTEKVVERFPESLAAALTAFIFLPTAWFWTSGITKEAIYAGGIGYLIYWFWPFFNRKPGFRPLSWCFGCIILAILIPLKYYYMAVFLPVFITTIIHYRLSNKFPDLLRGRIGWLMIFNVLLFGASWSHPNLNPGYLAELIQNNAHQILSMSKPASVIGFIDYQHSVVWTGINFPWALISGLYRPNLGDWGSWLQNLVIAEGLFVLVFSGARLWSLEKRHYDNAEWLPCMIYVIILAGFLTLSTPNFGTLVRFKTSYLPFFVFMVLHQNHWWLKFVRYCQNRSPFAHIRALA